MQLEKEGSLSAEELARLAAVSITLATERSDSLSDH